MEKCVLHLITER